jgi:hypothetical protein
MTDDEWHRKEALEVAELGRRLGRLTPWLVSRALDGSAPRQGVLCTGGHYLFTVALRRSGHDELPMLAMVRGGGLLRHGKRINAWARPGDGESPAKCGEDDCDSLLPCPVHDDAGYRDLALRNETHCPECDRKMQFKMSTLLRLYAQSVVSGQRNIRLGS